MAAVVTGTTLSVAGDVALKMILEELLLENLSLSVDIALKIFWKKNCWKVFLCLQTLWQQGSPQRG